MLIPISCEPETDGWRQIRKEYARSLRIRKLNIAAAWIAVGILAIATVVAMAPWPSLIL